MPLAKKGTRIINVNDIQYRWLVVPDDEPGLAIVVELLATSPGQRMVTWVEHGNIISPRVVRQAILHALHNGWEPQNPGKEIVFRLSNN